MPKKTRTPQPEQQPELTVTQEEAEKRISERIEAGEEIGKKQIPSPEVLKSVQDEFFRWDSFNGELLERLFTTDKFMAEYHFFGASFINTFPSFTKDLEDFRTRLSDKIHRLTSIKDRLPLIPVVPGVIAMKQQAQRQGSSNQTVFIVHGHDIAVRESVARFLERLGLEVVILHEQAGRGRTIIEKLEGHSDVEFAVILLTPDDVGAAKADAMNLKPRARQNVILELGYFVGKLGRERVCALHSEGVDLPSDFLGVQYVSLKPGWEMELGRELSAVFNIDMNRVLR
jgi:Predicted nucleotide-binding protein containing TIR-like domain